MRELISDPEVLWREEGLTTCSSCALARRCLSVQLDTRVVSLCSGCLCSEISLAVALAIYTPFAEQASPEDPRERLLFDNSSPSLAHEQVMLAIDYRFYWTPAEVKVRGWKSLENAVNHHAHPILWLWEENVPRWLWIILRKVPGSRIRVAA